MEVTASCWLNAAAGGTSFPFAFVAARTRVHLSELKAPLPSAAGTA